MARITVEDCLNNVDNRFQLIHLAAKRVRQLKKGAPPLVVCKNKDVVVALREIAAGYVFQAGKKGERGFMEALPEIGPAVDLEEGPSTETREDLQGQEIKASEEGEDLPGPEGDESQEAVEEK